MTISDIGVWFNAFGTWLLALCMLYYIVRGEMALRIAQQHINRRQ